MTDPAASTAPTTADVVVIGAGHNGLTAACYLARAGHDVVVVEALPAPGGMTASTRPIAAAPQHVINTCSAEFVFFHRAPVARELDLARHGLRMVDSDPPYVYLHPDGTSVGFFKDAGRTVRDIERLSRADAAAYRDWARVLAAFMRIGGPYLLSDPVRVKPRTLAKMARAAVSTRSELFELLALFMESGDAVVETRFSHPTVRSAVYSLIAGASSTSADGTGMAAALIAILHDTGAMRPVGGMQALPDALCRCLAEAGGRVVTDAPVASIAVEGGTARGVVLEDGREFRARRAVVASCDPRETVGRLLPASALDPALRRKVASAPAQGLGNGWVKVDLAFSGRVRPTRHEQWRGDGLDLRRPAVMLGEMDHVRRAYGLAAGGRVADAGSHLQWAFVPTGIDPSQAPDGTDTMYLSCPTMPLHPDDGWDVAAEAAQTAMLEHAGTFYDGLDLELGRVVETPPDLARRLRSTNGCIFHLDYTPMRFGPLRPALGLGGYATPVDRLYLSGAGTHPGGGVSGLPGRLAAAAILREI